MAKPPIKEPTTVSDMLTSAFISITLDLANWKIQASNVNSSLLESERSALAQMKDAAEKYDVHQRYEAKLQDVRAIHNVIRQPQVVDYLNVYTNAILNKGLIITSSAIAVPAVPQAIRLVSEQIQRFRNTTRFVSAQLGYLKGVQVSESVKDLVKQHRDIEEQFFKAIDQALTDWERDSRLTSNDECRQELKTVREEHDASRKENAKFRQIIEEVLTKPSDDDEPMYS